MLKKSISSIFLFAFICFHHPSFAQAQLGEAYDGHQTIVIEYGDMKVYKSYDDYVNNNFVMADEFKGKDFRKDKEKVLKIDDCWGWAIDYNGSTYLFRNCPACKSMRLLLVVKGSICAYFDGEPYYNPKKKQLFILLFQMAEPMYFSVGLGGEIQKFNRSNISDAVQGDGTASTQADAIKNVTMGGTDYIPPRMSIVTGYNKRHPSNVEEFNLMAASDHHKKS